jgi:hypothetical protein
MKSSQYLIDTNQNFIYLLIGSLGEQMKSLTLETKHRLAANLWIALARSEGKESVCDEIYELHPILDQYFIRKKELNLNSNPSKEDVVQALIKCSRDPAFCIAMAEEHMKICQPRSGKKVKLGLSKKEKVRLMTNQVVKVIA